MGYGISSTQHARLLADAARSPGAEICGLLFGTGDRIERAQPCANVAPDPTRAFELDPIALFAAHRAAREMGRGGEAAPIGHYHSHPSGEAVPSARDAAQAMGDGALWLIVTVTEARLFVSRQVGSFEEVALAVD